MNCSGPHDSHSSSTSPFHLLVVGGGIAGLACAHKFLNDRRWPHARVSVWERKDRWGGRVKTIRVREDAGGGWYEAGASRIGAGHRRVRALGRTLGCTELRLTSDYDHHQQHQSVQRAFEKIHARYVRKNPHPRALQAVTWYDVLTMECATLQERDALVRRWGFLSVLMEMNAYDFWHSAMPQYTHDAYYTVDQGLQAIPDRLVARLGADVRATLRTGVKVVGVERAPLGRVRVSYASDAVASRLPLTGPDPPRKPRQSHTHTFDMVVLALPAEALADLHGVPARYPHLWNAVSRNRLIRCYAGYPTPVENPAAATAAVVGARATDTLDHTPSRSRRIHSRDRDRTRTRSRTRTRRRSRPRPCPRPRPLVRLLSDLSHPRVAESALHKATTTQAQLWSQVVYCDHRHADHVLRLLRLPRDGRSVLTPFRRAVQKGLGAAWATYADSAFDVHYWKQGTHSWKPELCADDHYTRALQPDGKTAMYVVGASLSHYGHWMEGALETVDDAYKKMRRWAVEWLGQGSKRRSAVSTDLHHVVAHAPPASLYLHHRCDHAATTVSLAQVRSKGYVVLDGYVYDVRPIVTEHPGGSALLRNVLGTDISESYHRIGHSAGARAWVERHCVGRLKE